MECNRRDFFRESVMGLLGGLVSFGCAAGAVKEIHANEIRVAGGTLENMTVHGNIIVDARQDAQVSLRNISVVSDSSQNGSAITVRT